MTHNDLPTTSSFVEQPPSKISYTDEITLNSHIQKHGYISETTQANTEVVPNIEYITGLMTPTYTKYFDRTTSPSSVHDYISETTHANKKMVPTIKYITGLTTPTYSQYYDKSTQTYSNHITIRATSVESKQYTNIDKRYRMIKQNPYNEISKKRKHLQKW